MVDRNSFPLSKLIGKIAFGRVEVCGPKACSCNQVFESAQYPRVLPKTFTIMSYLPVSTGCWFYGPSSVLVLKFVEKLRPSIAAVKAWLCHEYLCSMLKKVRR